MSAARMPSARRGFLAVVGGALFAGVVQQASAATPTLILPRNLLTATVPSVDAYSPAELSGYPLLEAIYDRGESQMHALLEVKAGLPDDLFLDWMEGGLRMVEGCKPGGGIYRAMRMEGRA